MYSTFAFGKETREAGWTRFQIERNLPGDQDVQFAVKGRFNFHRAENKPSQF